MCLQLPPGWPRRERAMAKVGPRSDRRRERLRVGVERSNHAGGRSGIEFMPGLDRSSNNESVEHVLPDDPSLCERGRRPTLRSRLRLTTETRHRALDLDKDLLLDPLMGPARVVEREISPGDLPNVTFADHDEWFEAFRQTEPMSRSASHLKRRARANDLDALAPSDLVEQRRELVVAISEKEARRALPIPYWDAALGPLPRRGIPLLDPIDAATTRL